MPKFNYQSSIKAPSDLVFEWHRDPAAIEKLTPPWEPVKVVGTPASIEETGSRTTLELRIFGLIRLHWVAEHRNYQPGMSFQDVQISGPFARWCHTHKVEAIDHNSCLYTDSIDYKLPLGRLGELCGGWFIRRKLEKMFAYRHQRVKQECEALAAADNDGKRASGEIRQ